MSEDSSIEELRKKLYSRAGGPKARERRRLREEVYEIQDAWQEDEAVAPKKIAEEPKKEYAAMAVSRAGRTVRILLIASAGFFVVSLGVAAAFFFSGKSVVSDENIDIDVSGPVSVAGGEETSLQIEIVNRNPIPIILTDLIVEYPPGTKSPSDLATDMPRTRESIGTIAPGERVKRTARAILFGNEKQEQQIKLSLEYQIENSNALFTKDRTYNVLLSSAPLAVKVDTLKEISSGQPLEMTIHVVSNASKLIKGVILVADYPFGYRNQSADPKPAYGSNVWELGDLAPGTQRTIVLTGTLEGQNAEERVFRFEAGTQDTEHHDKIAAVFQKTDVPIMLKRPFIALDMQLGNTASLANNSFVLERGKSVQGKIFWANNLQSEIRDLQIELVLSGNVLNRNTVSAANGFYRSMDDTIIWSSEYNPGLSIVKPGEDGMVAFSFEATKFSLGENITNPSIQLVAHVRGKRLKETDVPEDLESTATGEVKVQAEPQMVSRLLYNIGPFQNAGPIPPHAEVETTYTVVWQLVNDINDVRNVTIASRLPSYVKWLGVVSPQDANLTYNPVSGQVIWNVNSLPAGTGYTTPPTQVAFQISFTPSLSQVGKAPILVEGQKFSGIDRFTNTVIEKSIKELTAQLSTDPNTPKDSGQVLP